MIRRVRGQDFAGEVQPLRLRAAELARRGARQGARRHQFDQALHPGDRLHLLANPLAQHAAFLGVGDAAVDQHGGRFLAILTLDREGRDIAVVEAGELFHRPLDILRPVVLAVDDDHVLRPADDEQVAVGHVAHVAGIEP